MTANEILANVGSRIVIESGFFDANREISNTFKPKDRVTK